MVSVIYLLSSNFILLVHNDAKITIVEEPDIRISEEDPYGEEDWDVKDKPDIDWSKIFNQ